MRAQVHFAAAVAFCGAIASTSARAELALSPCRLESAMVTASVAARCGVLNVAEDRDLPGGRTLRLHVAVVPALRLEPAADPLFILSGGPGQAAIDFYLAVGPAFARIRRDRDIVVLDQRGTGRSNRLECRLPEALEAMEVDPAQIEGAVRTCIETLPGDVRQYTTSVAVRDLEAARAALGYDAINLYGVSYGTRVAQHYMRRYPQRVRAAILDGVVPPDLALGPDVALEAQRALDEIFRRCATSPLCDRAFPSLGATFAALRGRLEREPLRLAVPDPLTAEMTTTTLDAARLAAAVRMLSYTDETASTLPLLIHDAGARDRPESLAAQYLMISRSMEEQIAGGMHFAVVCSEDAPRWSDAPAEEPELAATYIGAAFMAGMRAICAAWPRGRLDADFAEPLDSDVPVLLLSGASDPVTPPRYAERILPGLTRARHLVLAGQGHGQIATGCVPQLAAEFIGAGVPDELDAACVQNVTAAPFMLSRSASAP